MLIRSIILLFLATSFSACQSTDERDELRVYFSLVDLMEEQHSLLNDGSYSLVKEVELDGEREEMKITPDSTEWLRELEIFLELDINKPTFVGAFEEQKSGDAVNYTRIDQDVNGVINFQILFHEENSPKEISIKTVTNNSLYSSERKFSLSFEPLGDRVVLSRYSVVGQQVILSGEPVRYQLQVEVVNP